MSGLFGVRLDLLESDSASPVMKEWTLNGKVFLSKRGPMQTLGDHEVLRLLGLLLLQNCVPDEVTSVRGKLSAHGAT